MLNLDLNENPKGEINYARHEIYEEAKKKIASYNNLNPENIVITNGSFHALQLISTFFLKEGEEMLIPTPNFIFYIPFEKYGKFKVKKVEFNNKTYLEDIRNNLQNKKVVYLANPNNPIGYSIPINELEDIIDTASKSNTLVIVDEAYFEFNGRSVKNLVKKFNNLYVLRTFSKAFGLSGLRMGYIITTKENIKILEEIKGPPYIIGKTGLDKIKSLNQKDFKKVLDYGNRIKGSRKIFEKYLEENKIKYFPSSANFVTFQVKNSKEFTKSLFVEKGILVSDLSDYPDGKNLLKNHIRLTLPSSKKDTRKILKIIDRLIS